MKVSQLKIKAVQLYLIDCRQTVESAKKRIDFFRKYGFNTMFLYIEGKIRTASFHDLPEHESYSPEEIRTLVEYAAQNGIETIPVVSLFGHAADFFRVPALCECRELREGMTGRFGGKHGLELCPSNEKMLDFLKNYLSEIAGLFPGRYFHAGFDEVWNIGRCEQCRKRVETEGQSGIFLAHLKTVYRLVTETLGKQMMIWDDMFNLYPELLKELPKDLILCAWHYELQENPPKTHGDFVRKNSFAVYDRLGLSYLFVPSIFSMRNIASLTEYALQYHPLGACLSIWNDALSRISFPYVQTAYAGMLWSGNPENIEPETAIAETMPLANAAERILLHHYLTCRTAKFVVMRPVHLFYLRGPLGVGEFDRLQLVRVALATLAAYENRNTFLDEVLLGMREELVYFELRRVFQQLYTPGRAANMKTEVAAIAASLRQILSGREHLYRREFGSSARPYQGYYLEKILEMVNAMPVEGPLTRANLHVRYAKDTPVFNIFIKYRHSEQWHRIDSSFSYQAPLQGEFEAFYPFEPQGVPEAVKLEYQEFFMQGNMMYLEIETAETGYVPVAVKRTEGRIIQPEAMLADGGDVTYFGDGQQLSIAKFNDHNYRYSLHVLELAVEPYPGE